jgi:hypothetical protein
MEKAAIARLQSKTVGNLRSVKGRSIGLCSCCHSFQSCTYPRTLKQPVLQCEEFSGILPPPLRMPPTGKASLKKVRKPLARGLCSICEDRAACTYPKPEGGVWHCEDYR